MSGQQSSRWPYLGVPEHIPDAVQLGMSEKAFSRQLKEARTKLAEQRKQATAMSGPPPTEREIRVVARSWGWLEFAVDPNGHQLVGIGVAEPGVRPTGDMASSHHRPEWADSSVASGAVGAVPGAGAGYILSASVLEVAPLLAGVVAVVAGGVAGTGGVCISRWGRRLQRPPETAIVSVTV